MKINLPITSTERLFTADKHMVTKTDTKGVITFANQDFVEVSGFSEEELVGSSHNIIRHPDMPRAAFEVMWKTLKRGASWHGMVKNRCKNGDYYWVDAKVVPIRKGGRVIGYMSVRSCPSRTAVAAAEALYKRALQQPELIREEMAPAWKKQLSIRNGIPVWILFVTLIMIAGGILGITGLNFSKAAIGTLYYGELAPIQAIGRINFLLADDRAQVALALHQNVVARVGAGPNPADAYLQKLDRNRAESDLLWSDYVKGIHDATEQSLADDYAAAKNQYVEQGLLKAKRAFAFNNPAQAEAVLINIVGPLYQQADARASALLTYLSERGEAKLAATTRRIWLVVNVAVAGIAISCVLLVIAGVFFFWVTARPLEQAVLALENIAEGNLSDNIDTRGYGEPGRVMEAVATTQMHLKVMMHEIRQSSGSIHRQCHNLNQIMMNLAEHSEEQHDRVYQTVDAVAESRADLAAIAANMELLMLTVEDGAPLSDNSAVATAAAGGAGLRHPQQEQHGHFDAIPIELLSIFGDGDEVPENGDGQTDAPVDASPADPADDPHGAQPAVADVSGQVREISTATRVQSLAVGDVAERLSQIAGLIVQNREDVQGAWVASQQLEKTAQELDRLVKYFE